MNVRCLNSDMDLACPQITHSPYYDCRAMSRAGWHALPWGMSQPRRQLLNQLAGNLSDDRCTKPSRVWRPEGFVYRSTPMPSTLQHNLCAVLFQYNHFQVARARLDRQSASQLGALRNTTKAGSISRLRPALIAVEGYVRIARRERKGGERGGNRRHEYPDMAEWVVGVRTPRHQMMSHNSTHSLRSHAGVI